MNPNKNPRKPPEVGPAFADSGSPKPPLPPAPAHAVPDADHDDGLDHLDLSTWDYTPGGTIEQFVHTRISNGNRAAYQQQFRPLDEPEHEDHYRQQMASEFDRRATPLDLAHDTQATSETRPAQENPANHGTASPQAGEPANDLSPADLRADIERQLATLGPDFGGPAPSLGRSGPSR